jgi:hypothetical protein
MKRKFTFIDFIIILVVAIGIIGISGKFETAKVAAPVGKSNEEIYITFYIEETPDFVIDAISIGDPVTESVQGSNFGEVVEIKPGPSIYWKENEDGHLVSSSREGYSSLYLKMKTNGIISGSGVSIDKSVYYVGQTVTLYAGNSILKDGRISDATLID